MRKWTRTLVCIAAISIAGLSRLPTAIAQEKKNLAYDKPAPTVPARLIEQSKKMEQRILNAV